MTLDDVKFFTDSKVVLGYIFNESRRFYVYVHNRVQRIRRSTKASQWNYVSTDHNPADHATQSLPADQLVFSSWLTGPAFLTEVRFNHLTRISGLLTLSQMQSYGQTLLLVSLVSHTASLAVHALDGSLPGVLS